MHNCLARSAFLFLGEARHPSPRYHDRRRQEELHRGLPDLRNDPHRTDDLRLDAAAQRLANALPAPPESAMKRAKSSPRRRPSSRARQTVALPRPIE
jgi:hypothetical protein